MLSSVVIICIFYLKQAGLTLLLPNTVISFVPAIQRVWLNENDIQNMDDTDIGVLFVN